MGFGIVAVRKLRTWIEVEQGSEEYIRPDLIIFVLQNTGVVLKAELLKTHPTPPEVQKELAQTMFKPFKGTAPAHRPLEIHFEDQALVDALSPFLKELNIVARYQPQPELMNELINSFMQLLMPDDMNIPGLLKQAGVKPEFMGQLMDAALFFYQSKPWEYFTDTDLVAVQVGSQKDPYYVSIMGNGEKEYGLSIFQDWKDVETFFKALDPEEAIPDQGRHVFFFNRPPIVSFDDLEAIEKYGWPLPEPNLYPSPFLFKPDKVLRPTIKMLRWYEAALRAIPLFVAQSLKDNQPVENEMDLVVDTGAGKAKVHILYPGGDPVQLQDWIDQSMALFDPDLDDMDEEQDLFDLDQDIDLLSDLNPELVEAQELVYSAWEENNPKKQIAMAKAALKLSPDCADAYVLLAEHEDSNQKLLGLYKKGVEAGRRALGESFFENAANLGHFWGIIETRPYMRALEGMAFTLWDMGQNEEAEIYYRQMLHLNPGDHQGARFSLLELLLETDHLNEAEDLLKEYEGDSNPDWLFTKALLTFRKSGDSQEAKQALKRAMKSNKHIVDFLTGEKVPPTLSSPYITPGSENEAADYIFRHLQFWHKTPGAIEWLTKKK